MSKADEVRMALAKDPKIRTTVLARELGVHPSFVSRFKTGNHRAPRVKTERIDGFAVEEAVKNRMHELKVSFVSLGKAAGVHGENIRKWYSGSQNSIATNTLFALAEALGIKFTLETLDVTELPEKHPARRLRTRGMGGRSSRSVWRAPDGRELPYAEPTTATSHATKQTSSDSSRDSAIAAHAASITSAHTGSEAEHQHRRTEQGL